MREFAFEPGVIDLKVGERVELHIRNQGAAPHEWSAGMELVRNPYEEGFRRDLLAFLKPQVSRTGIELEEVRAGSLDPEERFEGETVPRLSQEVDLKPGGEAVLRFTVPEAARGEWDMGCLLPGQYDSGLNGIIRIG